MYPSEYGYSPITPAGHFRQTQCVRGEPKKRIRPLGEEALMERFWCIDCRAPVDLNRHGRCECCDSEAVDTMERNYMQASAAPIVLATSSESSQPLTVQLAPVLLFGTNAPSRATRLLEALARRKTNSVNSIADDACESERVQEYGEYASAMRRIQRVS